MSMREVCGLTGQDAAQLSGHAAAKFALAQAVRAGCRLYWLLGFAHIPSPAARCTCRRLPASPLAPPQGFPRNRCARSLLATRNEGLQVRSGPHSALTCSRVKVRKRVGYGRTCASLRLRRQRRWL